MYRFFSRGSSPSPKNGPPFQPASCKVIPIGCLTPYLNAASIYSFWLFQAIVCHVDLGDKSSKAYRGTIKMVVPSGPFQLTSSPPWAAVYPPKQVFGFLSDAYLIPKPCNTCGSALVKQGSS